MKVICEACGAKLTSVLVELSSAVMHRPESDSQEGRQKFGQPGVMEDGRFFLTAVLMAADDLLVGGDWELLEPFSEEVCGVSSHPPPVLSACLTAGL